MNIFSLPILEIAVSIIICWMLISVLCSMLQETLVQIKGERGRFLKKYILKQLYDTPNQINWGAIMYTHSSIDLLSREYNKPPSEITPKIFSETLIETIASSHMVQSMKNEKLQSNIYKTQLLNDFSFAVEVLLPSDVISFLKSALTKAKIKANGDEEKLYNELVNEISDWYEQLCGMTSIWYKKATKTRLFFLGLAVSIAFNIDSIALFEYFKSNPQARQGVIEYYAENEAYYEDLIKKYSTQVTVSPSEENNRKLDSLKSELKDFYLRHDQIADKYEIPVGWNLSDTPDAATNQEKERNILLMFAGYLITAIAASMGAPFWFAILKNNPLKK